MKDTITLQERAIHWFISMWDHSRLLHEGGYRSDYIVYDGLLFLAGVDHDQAPTLNVYAVSAIKKGYRAAQKRVLCGAAEDMGDAWCEVDIEEARLKK